MQIILNLLTTWTQFKRVAFCFRIHRFLVPVSAHNPLVLCSWTLTTYIFFSSGSPPCSTLSTLFMVHFWIPFKILKAKAHTDQPLFTSAMFLPRTFPAKPFNKRWNSDILIWTITVLSLSNTSLLVKDETTCVFNNWAAFECTFYVGHFNPSDELDGMAKRIKRQQSHLWRI